MDNKNPKLFDVVKSTKSTTTHRGLVPVRGLREALGLPNEARIFVSFPCDSGVGYINLDIGRDARLYAEWQTTKEN